MEKRIAVIGAGAIGGYTGGQLAHNGFDVTLIDPWPEHVEAIRKNGLAIEGVTQEEFVRVRPKTMHLTEVQRVAKEKPFDIAMVAVKSYDTEWATRLIAQYLAPNGYVVSLQNCMNEERIAGIVGWDKTVGAIPALLAAELYAAGKVRRTVAKGASTHDVYRVGEVHGRITRRLEELAAMIATVDTVKPTTNLWGERWSKLCVNGMRNGIGAATGLSGNGMDRHDRIRRLSIRLGGEAVRVGQALGYQLEHIRMHDPETLARAGEGDPKALDEVEFGHSRRGGLEHAQRSAAPVDGPGHAEGKAHRDRFHQRVDRRQGRRSRRVGIHPSETDYRGQGGRARQAGRRTGKPVRDLNVFHPDGGSAPTASYLRSTLLLLCCTSRLCKAKRSPGPIPRKQLKQTTEICLRWQISTPTRRGCR